VLKNAPVPDLILRPALPDEAASLSDLALRSKGQWGYDDAFLTACREELTVHPRQCDAIHVVVAERAGTLVGYYRLEGDPPAGELADLFVDPPAIGQGIGGRLLADALERARSLKFELLKIDADPNAEAFYVRAGATRVGTVPSESITGRLLPRLELLVAPRTYRSGRSILGHGDP